MRRAILGLSLFISTGVAFGHTKLKPGGTLKLREDNPGVKTGPCGSAPRSGTPTELRAGQQVLVEWLETINHPGYFRISFSEANDVGFDQNVLATVQDDKNGTNDLPHAFSKTITVPNKPCERCTIQLIQMMTDNPQNPSPYFSCADIKIIGDSAPVASTTPTPEPEQPIEGSSGDQTNCDK